MVQGAQMCMLCNQLHCVCNHSFMPYRVVTPLYIGQKSTMFVTMLFYIIGFLDFMLFWEGVEYTAKQYAQI